MGRLFELLSRTSDGAFAVDGNQRIVFWNPAAQRILGRSAKEVLGAFCHEVIAGCDQAGDVTCEPHCPTWRAAVRQQNSPTCEVRSVDGAGRTIWLSMTTIVVPSTWRELTVLVHMFRDASRGAELEQSMRVVLARFESLDPSPVEKDAAILSPPVLTNREREILGLLAAGSSTDQIVESLFISKATVRNHVHNILTKLGVSTRLEAVTHSLRTGLIDLR